MSQLFERQVRLVGTLAMERLLASHVMVLGLGGVGGACAEALARAGVGELTLMDDDVVTASNTNRQIVALSSTQGQHKAHVMAARVRDIHPHCRVHYLTQRYSAQNDALPVCDFVVDAIDDVKAKVHLIEKCGQKDIPLICCMGTGNKLDPMQFRIDPLGKTKMDPIARILRKGLKARGIKEPIVLWSEEKPILPPMDEAGGHSPASISFVPPIAGMLMARHVILQLIKDARFITHENGDKEID